MNKTLRSLLLKAPKFYELVYNLKNNYLLGFYLNQVHEADFNAFKLICKDSPQMFLDIGANVGMSALSFFTLKPNSQVISFEPNPINYPYLDRLSQKFKAFQYMKFGLGNQPGLIDFYYPIYNGKKMTALGSYDYQTAQNWLNEDTVYFFDANKLEIQKITININILDSFNLQPEFIKIDVEGFEYQVLLGSEQTIKNNRPVLLIEGVAKENKVHKLLQNWGYDTYKFFKNKFYLDQFDCANNFFIPKEKPELVQPYLGN